MAPRPPARSPLVRVVLVLASALTAWHLFASFLWIAPPSPLREVVPGEALRGYMLPMFGQSWSVFAPEPVNGSHRLLVRAVVLDGGRERTTEWVDATAAETSMIQDTLFPPRAGIQAGEVAGGLKGRFEKLSTDQQKVAGLDDIAPGWPERLAAQMRSLGEEEAVAAYLEQDRRATAYATQVALAVWGEGVQGVQYEVSRQNVVPFASRNDPDASPPARTTLQTGWRAPLVLPGQSQQAFRDVFLPAYERTGR